MSKKLTELRKSEKEISKQLEAIEKKKQAVMSKSRKLSKQWPKSFRCNKCGLAFKINELGYKTYEVVKDDMDCQYGGEYDIKQITEQQFITCCPKCGHDFGVQACPSTIIHCTPTYSRWEDKPDFQTPYKKLTSRTIEKVDSRMIRHLNDRFELDWV